MKKFISVVLFVVPWSIRRPILNLLFGYKIHPTARIGFSVICPARLEMGPRSCIGNLNMCKGLELLRLGETSLIGNLNWITGFPANDDRFFSADLGRRPELIIGDHAAITSRHLIDCTNRVTIGEYATVAGTRSQFLTHSINLHESRQSSRPIIIGKYCFIGTASVLLGGSALPDYCVLGACSLLNKSYTETHFLYAGNPARAIKALPQDMAYFQRISGFVY